jgi:Rps23 Pro-64 3,4-dihydroxylase Tpa1-like proline 4-hydroxylase
MKAKFIYENDYSLCPEICDEIINLFESSPDKSDGLIMSGVNKSIKDTMNINISKSGKWKNIYECLESELAYNIKNYRSMIGKYAEADYVFFSDKLEITQFMVQRYIQNEGKYTYHNDFHMDTGKQKFRVITYIFYLNDVSEGGETEYFGGEIRITPKCGKLVLFPSSWTFPHCGRMPISSNKYIITGWVYDYQKI